MNCGAFNWPVALTHKLVNDKWSKLHFQSTVRLSAIPCRCSNVCSTLADQSTIDNLCTGFIIRGIDIEISGREREREDGGRKTSIVSKAWMKIYYLRRKQNSIYRNRPSIWWTAFECSGCLRWFFWIGDSLCCRMLEQKMRPQLNHPTYSLLLRNLCI